MAITTDIQPEASASVVLSRVRSARERADAAEAELLVEAVAWGHLHAGSSVDEAATLVSDRGEDTGITLAGPGAPLVSEFAVVEFATTLRLSDYSGRLLLGHALELFHRLPRVWARVQAGDLPAWRGRKIADQTLLLSFEAAAWVDGQVARFAHKIGPAATQRLVEEAIARFMPDLAVERRQAAADGRHVTVHDGQVSFNGTVGISGELDLADALDFDTALAQRAETLAGLGCSESLNVRRSLALGEIARDQLALDLTTDPDTGAVAVARPAPARRSVTLYVHLSESALTRTGCDLGRVENRGPTTVLASTLREWLGVAGTQVTVRPVIDLNTEMSSTAHELPERMSEQALLRDQTCIFPFCTRPARACDDEHCIPYDSGGPSATSNIARMCRKHHRAKTHGGWRYRIIRPGTYEWTSPHGQRWLRDPSGTTDLNPTHRVPEPPDL